MAFSSPDCQSHWPSLAARKSEWIHEKGRRVFIMHRPVRKRRTQLCGRLSEAALVQRGVGRALSKDDSVSHLERTQSENHLFRLPVRPPVSPSETLARLTPSFSLVSAGINNRARQICHSCASGTRTESRRGRVLLNGPRAATLQHRPSEIRCADSPTRR